jgi:hypothetical protein
VLTPYLDRANLPISTRNHHQNRKLACVTTEPFAGGLGEWIVNDGPGNTFLSKIPHDCYGTGQTTNEIMSPDGKRCGGGTLPILRCARCGFERQR